MVKSVVVSYFQESYCRGSELQRAMVARFMEVKLSVLLLGAFVLAASVGFIKWLLVDRMITSLQSRGAVLRALSVIIKD